MIDPYDGAVMKNDDDDLFLSPLEAVPMSSVEAVFNLPMPSLSPKKPSLKRKISSPIDELVPKKTKYDEPLSSYSYSLEDIISVNPVPETATSYTEVPLPLPMLPIPLPSQVLVPETSNISSEFVKTLSPEVALSLPVLPLPSDVLVPKASDISSEVEPAPKKVKKPKEPKAPKEPKEPKAPKEPKEPKAPKEPKVPKRKEPVLPKAENRRDRPINRCVVTYDQIPDSLKEFIEPQILMKPAHIYAKDEKKGPYQGITPFVSHGVQNGWGAQLQNKQRMQMIRIGTFDDIKVAAIAFTASYIDNALIDEPLKARDWLEDMCKEANKEALESWILLQMII